ncbi:helix-turn-helix domain-containing protein [Embleya sp. NBC_00888]|uniref:helix-turn-helix domain-containing protein n=1 Tax=Embleya sp. NBC_00888 TaxID=2975960 RepID=UPI003867B632|nr:helix-turn-helix domain-containing protein [Embleya sp. NBC_00888]
MPATPTYAQRRLGNELRGMRTDAALSMDAVANLCDWSESKVSRMENAKVAVSRHDIHAFALACGASSDRIARLESLLTDSRGVRWWAEYADILISSYEEFISLEAQASDIYVAHASIVPGLLQSRSYAHAVITSSPLVPDPENAESLVEIRVRRQQILTGDHPVNLVAVINAAVLHCEIGGLDSLREQLAHLVDLGDMANVDIHVVPFSSDVSAYVGGITLFDFPGDYDPSVVYVEYQGGADFKESDRDIRRYRRNFEYIKNGALSLEASRKAIITRLDEL